MKITLEGKESPRKGRSIEEFEEGEDRATVKTYCISDLSRSKQQKLVEGSFQMRCRIYEFNASIGGLSQQEVPDFFSGPAMAKTITQEMKVVFGPEQEEWNLAELQSFATLGVYEVVTLADVGGQEILPGRLVLVVKPNPEGEKGKKKARIVVCGNFQTVHQYEMTLSKTPPYPMLRMSLSLASYQRWPIETWDVSTAFLYARLHGPRYLS